MEDSLEPIIEECEVSFRFLHLVQLITMKLCFERWLVCSIVLIDLHYQFQNFEI